MANKNAKGRPRKGLERIQLTLTPELINMIRRLAKARKCQHNELVESSLRAAFRMEIPSESDQTL